MGPSAAGAKCDLRTLVEPVMVRGSVTLLYFPLTQRVVSQFQEMSSEQGGEGHCGALCKSKTPNCPCATWARGALCDLLERFQGRKQPGAFCTPASSSNLCGVFFPATLVSSNSLAI